jgi:metabolite-proton symporter
MQAVEQSRTPLLRVVLASLIGTTIEWYDFFLYGTAAALIFNKLFFPTFDPLTGTLLAFVTFAVGFIARPIGGIVFGHFGDRIGRKKLLMLSLILMGASTTAIGLLPTYSSAGMLAPLMLVFLRLIQGFAVGGEWGGAVLMIAEYSPKEHRGFYASWPQFGVPAGNLLAAAALAVMSATLSEEDFLQWGWRVPFLASAILVLVGWWIRQAVDESPLFRRIGSDKHVAFPLAQVLRRHWRQVAIGVGVKTGSNIGFYAISAFGITWLTEINGQPKSVALTALLAGSAVQCLTIPLFSALSDRVGRRPVFISISLIYAAFIFAFYPLLSSSHLAWIYLAVMFGLALDGALYGPQAAFLAELFPTPVRYSGASLAYQFSSIIGGSLTPIIAIALFQQFGSSIPISIYVSASLLVCTVAALLSRETRRVELAKIH